MPTTLKSVATPANTGDRNRATAPLCADDALDPVACEVCALVVFAALLPAEPLLCEEDDEEEEELEGGAETGTPIVPIVSELLASAEFW